jgi:hypothetical protein
MRLVGQRHQSVNETEVHLKQCYIMSDRPASELGSMCGREREVISSLNRSSCSQRPFPSGGAIIVCPPQTSVNCLLDGTYTPRSEQVGQGYCSYWLGYNGSNRGSSTWLLILFLLLGPHYCVSALSHGTVSSQLCDMSVGSVGVHEVPECALGAI